MIRKMEITFNVSVDLSEEDYDRIMQNVSKSQKSGFGLELWEIEQLINPKRFDKQNHRRTYFPTTIEMPEMSFDAAVGVTISTTKIEFIS